MEDIRAAYLRWIKDYCNNQFSEGVLPGGVELALEQLVELHDQNPNVASESVSDLSRSFFSSDLPASIRRLLRPYRRVRFE